MKASKSTILRIMLIFLSHYDIMIYMQSAVMCMKCLRKKILHDKSEQVGRKMHVRFCEGDIDNHPMLRNMKGVSGLSARLYL